MVRVTNDDFVKKAEACAPKLIRDSGTSGFYRRYRKNRGYLSGCPSREMTLRIFPPTIMAKGDRICLDFGDHQVGYVTLKLDFCRKPAGCTGIFQTEIR